MTVMFDTLKFVEKLRNAGISEDQAKAFSDAFQDVTSEGDLATKRDIERLEAGTKLSFERTEAKIDRLDVRLTGDINLLKWMMTFLLGGMVAMLFKLFA
jgi:hypothetical protein